jgi:glycosyltransferase involved in cell wall biosynthesis
MQTVLFIAAKEIMSTIPRDAMPGLPTVYKWLRVTYGTEPSEDAEKEKADFEVVARPTDKDKDTDSDTDIWAGPTLTFAALSKVWRLADPEPAAIITYGDKSAWPAMSVCYQTRRRWLHYNAGELPPALNSITTTIMGMVYCHTSSKTRPVLLSAFTSTYHSGTLLRRPYDSLVSQSHRDWEWVVWDDSTTSDSATFDQLQDMAAQDLRIRVFRAPAHSGSIGAMKRLATGCAVGDILVELDHDDHLHPDLFAWLAAAAKAHPDANFFYTDTAEMHEESLAPVIYGSFFAFGFSGHYMTWSPVHGQFVVAATAPTPNPTTLRHIVGVPNHVRAWRRDAYDRLGKHNPLLSVADDYDLIVRTYLDAQVHPDHKPETKPEPAGNAAHAHHKPPGSTWCHIRRCGYYQYRNKSSHGNFTFIRNALIQRNVAAIRSHYEPLLPAVHPDAARGPLWKPAGPKKDGADGDPSSSAPPSSLYALYPQTHLVYDPEGEWSGPPLVIMFPESASDVVDRLPEVYDPKMQLVIMGVPVAHFNAFTKGQWRRRGWPSAPSSPIPPDWRRNILGWSLESGKDYDPDVDDISDLHARYASIYLTWTKSGPS